MKYYIGIDLGTTNSAICSYDGQNVRVWKSPEQNDVTPSAIYVDKRGNRYYGNKAYNQAPYNPNNSATLFKRFMGTSTKIELEASQLVLTPEECSAEVLKVLYGYLPEEIRNDPETSTVITVPAAFNQMKKDATLQAAKLAGLGRVALMQEPVAAIMSVMRSSKLEGIFLVYDLGGGTFDVSIAENINGKVNLLAHGGIEMCGGRDIDRTIFNQIVIPWLTENFSLPDDLLINRKYKTFCRVAQWATERAKIELSSTDNCTIALSEGEARTIDEDGNELYLDIDISREMVDKLMADLVDETVAATRETMEKAGLSANDIERIVFVGGPTNYKPLRDKVAFELSVPANIDVIGFVSILRLKHLNQIHIGLVLEIGTICQLCAMNATKRIYVTEVVARPHMCIMAVYETMTPSFRTHQLTVFSTKESFLVLEQGLSLLPPQNPCDISVY